VADSPFLQIFTAKGSDLGPWLVIPRTAIVFVMAIAYARLAKKRFIAQASAADLVMAVIFGSVLSRAINGGANLVPSLVAGIVLVVLQRLVAHFGCRSRPFTLERGWDGGGVYLYESTAAEAELVGNTGRLLKDTHDGTSNSVSGFLLAICGLEGKFLRRNESGAKDSLSFRNLPNYVLVQEERIITTVSPILSGIPTDRTKEHSLFKLLLTGADDSAIHETPDPKTRRGLDSGRREVIDSLVQGVRDRISANGRTEEELGSELQAIEDAFDSQTEYIRDASSTIESHFSRRRELWPQRQELEAGEEHSKELIMRFSLLDRHYDADLARLQSTQESGRLLVQISEGPCPLCGADPIDHQHEGLLKSEDVEALTEACEAEQRKIDLLKAELRLTIRALEEEQIRFASGIREIDAELADIQASLTLDLEPRIGAFRAGFEDLYNRRKNIERNLAMYSELRALESTRTEFEIKTKVESEKRTFDKAPPGAADELAKLIGEILTAWNYPGLERVVFESTTNDILIDSKPRGSNGKGYRAITYAAFMVGLMVFCRRKGLPHPGFVVLDSPLVTYRRPDKNEAEGDLISEGMVPPFYNYLAELPENCQVIVIENDEPLQDVMRRSTYTHFTRNREVGRFGYLGEPSEND
jgi:hypothetical protein